VRCGIGEGSLLGIGTDGTIRGRNFCPRPTEKKSQFMRRSPGVSGHRYEGTANRHATVIELGLKPLAIERNVQSKSCHNGISVPFFYLPPTPLGIV
jgi:hypothetical protein